MQFTVDTRNATAFELNALAEFARKLATCAPIAEADGWSINRHPSGAVIVSGKGEMPASMSAYLRAEKIDLGNAQAAAQSPAQPAASGAPDLPPAAGPAPEVPPAPGNTPPAVAVAPASTAQTDVPAVPTSVPAAPASTSAADPAGGQVELDSAGCPWSPMIHTSNKATIGDGTWRKKPGVNPEYFESVRAELMAGNATAAVSTTPPAVPAAPATEQASPAPDAPALLTGNDVMARAMEIQMADGTKSAALFQAIQGAGIPAGPMGLPGCTDQAVLAAALDAVNTVGAQ